MNAAGANPVPKILVVEDEPIVAADMEQTLTGLGYDVVGTTGRGSEALQLAEQNFPDLVLMDIQLAGEMDGITAAAQIRQRFHIPTVFVTANTSESTIARAKTAEPLGYLGKPFGANELNATVSIALQQRQLVQELFAERTWLTTLLASISDGVIATDRAGLIRYMNPVAEKLTGSRATLAAGKPIEQVYRIFTLHGGAVRECSLRRALATGEGSQRALFLLQPRSGERVPIEDAAAPIHDNTGYVAGAVMNFVDISARARAEQRSE